MLNEQNSADGLTSLILTISHPENAVVLVRHLRVEAG